MQIVILAVDVHYGANRAVTAGVIFEHWEDRGFHSCHVSETDGFSDYIPGQFYKRELPCIVQLMNEHRLSVETILIDGYVYLDGRSRPGLGRHLYDALGRKVKVIGVAKNPFAGIPEDCAVFRGVSKKPLYVTAAGERLAVAKKLVKSMYGSGRRPVLLQRADQLSRSRVCR